MRKHLRVIFTLALALLMLIISIPQSLVAAQPEKFGTGLKEPTAAQKQWINDNIPVVKQVRLNTIGLERVNSARIKKGMNSLTQQDVQVVELGQELGTNSVSIGGSTTTAAVGAVETVDNSASSAFPPVRSQGGLGSCAAWATTYYQLTYENNLARGRVASNGDNTAIFSPKWTYNMINGGSNAGSYFSDNYAMELKHGAATWADFPYDTNYRAWDLDPDDWREALKYRPTSMGQLYNSNVDVLISDIKTQLVNGHVLVIGTYVSSWVQYTAGNNPAVTEDDALAGQKIAGYMSNTNSGGHAMTIVGFNNYIWVDLNGNGQAEATEKGAFKIANSWGTGDWNAGYRWVSYDAVRSVSAVPSGASWPPAARSTSGIFWKGNIFTLTVNPDYSPTLVAQFTLNHAKRNQMAVTLGTGAVTATQPSSVWTPRALYNSGGAYAFDGTTVARDATFVMDFSDLAANTVGNTRWFIGMADNTAGYPAALLSYQLYQVTGTGDVLVASAAGVPLSADGSKVYAWVDYAMNSLNQPPVAAPTANPASGTIPLVVNFNGSSSYDTDGQITSYTWNFGDGTTASGATVSHTYTTAKIFTATLTVTDDRGAVNTASVKITASAPVTVNAPSRLNASVSRTKVTLKWTDNSKNETGFYIERASRTASGYSAYTVIGQTAANIKTWSQTATPGTYKYRVRAFNQGTVSAYSNEVSVTVKK